MKQKGPKILSKTTAKINSIAKRQHYHLNHIIKKFSINDEVLATFKLSNKKLFKKTDDGIFVGISSWSHETESHISEPIERKAIGQIRSIIQGQNVSNHYDLSSYDLLWKIRYHHAHNPSERETIYKGFNFGEMDPDLKSLANHLGKLPFNGDGSIDGMYAATQKVKSELQTNSHKYDNLKWRVYRSEDSHFFSPDCYMNRVLLPISPKILLEASHQKHKPVTLTPREVDEFNSIAFEQCHNFYFEKPLIKS